MDNIRLKHYNTKTGKFVFLDNEYDLDQVVLIHEIIKKLGGFPNLTNYNRAIAERDAIASKDLKKLATEEDKLKKIFINPKLSVNQLKYFKVLLDSHLITTQLKVIFNPSYSLPQMNVLATSYLYGLDEKQVSLIANAKFDINQMTFIRDRLIDGTDVDVVKAFADPKYTTGQMEDLFKDFQDRADVLTAEGKALAIHAFMKDKYLDELLDLDLVIDSNKSPREFLLDGKAIDKDRLEQLVAKGGSPDAFQLKKKYFLDDEISNEVFPLVEAAIDADAGEFTIDAIAGSKDLASAQNILKDSMESLTGNKVEFIRKTDDGKYRFTPKTKIKTR